MTTMTSELPVLRGSEKQIAWASEIRAKQIAQIDRSFAGLDRVIDFALRGEPMKSKAGTMIAPITLPSDWEATRNLFADAYAILRGEDSARFWIDRRDRRVGGISELFDIAMGLTGIEPDSDQYDATYDRIWNMVRLAPSLSA